MNGHVIVTSGTTKEVITVNTGGGDIVVNILHGLLKVSEGTGPTNQIKESNSQRITIKVDKKSNNPMDMNLQKKFDYTDLNISMEGNIKSSLHVTEFQNVLTSHQFQNNVNSVHNRVYCSYIREHRNRDPITKLQSSGCPRYLTPKSKSTIKLHFTSQFKQSVSLHSVRTPVFHDPDSSSGSFYYIHGRDVNGGHCVPSGGLQGYSLPQTWLCRAPKVRRGGEGCAYVSM